MLRWIQLVVVTLALLTSLSFTRADSYSDTLKAAGVESDRDAIAKYLKQFQPTPEERKKIDALIKQFGDDDFNVREAASAAVKKLPVLPRAALDKAAGSEDAEVKWRAEEALKQGNEQEQVLLLAAMKVIDRQKHKGLLADVVAVFPYIAGSEGRTAGRRAIAATATMDDAAKLRELLKREDTWLRAAGVAALSTLLGKDAVADARPLLGDNDESVRLAAARALADVGDRACLETYLTLLESKQFAVQWEAESSLRWLSGKTMKVAGEDDEKRRAMLAQAWRAWAGGEGKTAALRFPIQLAERIDLFNGNDLSGWQAVHGGQRVSAKDVWSVKDGVIQCNGKASGYLRTQRSFLNYELIVDWRWPAGTTTGDSGIWLMLSGPDAALPKGLEAQLGAGNAGDFWTLAGFQCKTKGKPITGLGKKFADSSEKPAGQWNTMTIRVHQGTVTVKVNGVEQNVATDCPKEPGCVALQVEGHALEFRNISVLPLED
jgi:HEAT repeat protein